MKTSESLKFITYRIALTVLLGSFIIPLFIYFVQLNNMKQTNYGKIQLFHNMFDEQLNMKKADLLMSLNLILKNEKWMKAFEEGDRGTLSKDLVGFFKKKLKPVYGIRQIQFHLPSSVNFFRVSKPNHFGDDLSGKRKIVVEANRSKKGISGIEMEKNGLGFRLIVPVKKSDGGYIGALELGVSVKSIFDSVSQVTGGEYSLGIYKEIYKKAARFGDNESDVVLGNMVYYDFSSEKAYDFMTKGIMEEDGSLDFPGNQFVTASFPLTDFSNKKIGEVVVLIDPAEEHSVLFQNYFIGVITTIFLGCLLIFVLYLDLRLHVFVPLKDMKQIMKNIATGKGNLTNHIAVRRMDEIGKVAFWFNALIDSVKAIVISVRSSADTLKFESEDLYKKATAHVQDTNGMGVQANVVTESTSIMKNTIESIATIASEIENSVAAVYKVSEKSSYSSNDLEFIKSTIEELLAEVNRLSDFSEVGKKNVNTIEDTMKNVDQAFEATAFGSTITQKGNEEINNVADRMYHLVSSFDVGEGAFDSVKVKEDHITWKSKLEKFFEGSIELQVNDVSSETECPFGQWFFNFQVGDEIKSHSCYEGVIKNHHKVHELAKEIVDIKHQGDTKKAQEKLIEFESARYGLFAALDEFTVMVNTRKETKEKGTKAFPLFAIKK